MFYSISFMEKKTMFCMPIMLCVLEEESWVCLLDYVKYFVGKLRLEFLCIVCIGTTTNVLALLYLHAPKAKSKVVVLLLNFKLKKMHIVSFSIKEICEQI